MSKKKNRKDPPVAPSAKSPEASGTCQWGAMREKAEERARLSEAGTAAPVPEETSKLLHELRVHQIELEMQNEELRRTQVELETSRSRYFELYDLAPVGYFTVSEKGLILEANLIAASLLGVSRGSIGRQPLTRFIFREDQDIYYNYRKQLFETGAPQVCELRMIKADGIPFIVRMDAIRAQDADGAPVSHIIVSDITERKLAEATIKKLNETLNIGNRKLGARTAELELANKELESFSFSVSHDLRAPLRHISGFITLLHKEYEGQFDETFRHYMEVIAEASKKMGRLIDDLLALSHIGRSEMHKEEINMKALIDEAILEVMCGEGNRQIEWKVDDLSHAYGDRSLMSLALINLISNAVKFTRLSPRAEIEIRGKEDGAGYVYYVRDNGVGFDMRHADKLFGVFQRFHTQKEFEGTGIGLSNVQRIISKHGGRIWAESEVGHGATFYFTLPKAVPSQVA